MCVVRAIEVADDAFDAGECKRAMYQFMGGFASLHYLFATGLPAADAASQPYHPRPKLHMLQHLVEEQLRLWGQSA